MKVLEVYPLGALEPIKIDITVEHAQEVKQAYVDYMEASNLASLQRIVVQGLEEGDFLALDFTKISAINVTEHESSYFSVTG